MPEVKKQVFYAKNSSNKEWSSKKTVPYKIGDSYTSYSGCDIVVSVQIPKINPDGSETNVPYVLGSLQTISISTYQDKNPVRAIGNVNALDYTMGPRTIAGSLVFAVFDKHFADEIFDDLNKENTNVLIDELPGLDITITYANEYGSISRMALYGVRIVEEGQVISINDVYTENTYKYCALSLERLNKKNKHSNNKISDKKPVISTFSSTDNKVDTPGKDMLDKLEENKDKLKEENIRLSVEVENPTNNYKNGIAHFYLRPKQKNGYIHIYNITGDEVKKINVTEENSGNSSNVYTTELKVGSYSAQYKNELELRFSNIVNFVISKNENIDYSFNDEPIYEFSNSSSYVFAPNNKEHTSFVAAEGIYEDLKDLESNVEDNKVIEGLINNETSITHSFNIELEKPNTYYTVFTGNKHNVSKPKIIITEKDGHSILEKFIKFVKYNKDKLIYDLNQYDEVISLLIKNYNNKEDLIDNVLKLEESKYKTELLYYSITFQNLITRAYNYKINFFVEKDNKYPFFNNTIHNNVQKTLFFERKNNKDYFSSSKQNISTNLFLSKYGYKYYTYDTENNYRSTRYQFVCFSPEEEYLLKKYNKVNTIKDIDVSMETKTLYKKLDENEIIYAQLKLDNSPEFENLEQPSVHYNYDTNELNVDINYLEELGQNNNKYYIAIKEMDLMNDYTPTTKVEFSTKEKEKVVNAFNGYLLRNKYYFVWIEDSDTNTISKISMISTYSDEIEFIKYINNVDIEKMIDEIKEKIDKKYHAVLSFVLSEENITIKNLKYKIIEEIYNYLDYDIDLNESLYDIVSTVLKKDCYQKDEFVELNKKNKTMKLKNVNEKDHIVVFTLTKNKELEIDVYENNETIKINNIKGHTIVFVSKNKGLQRSDIVVVDNKTFLYDTKIMKVGVI